MLSGSVPILAHKIGTCLLVKHLLVHVQYILKLPGDLKGLSHEIDFKNVDKNLQNLA